jgi:hypothetical protein
MGTYWFREWMKTHRVKDGLSLEKALVQSSGLDSLLSSAPEPIISMSNRPAEIVELTGGKGIDLTGELGCHHIDCLQKEINGLFRHTWHYFDRIILPDQAIFHVVEFNHHKDVSHLIQRLTPFVQVIKLLERDGALDLVSFEVRTPSCDQHFRQHAHEAGIDQAFTNTVSLANEIAKSARISWEHNRSNGHLHLDYRLDHPEFQHSEWGSICSLHKKIPNGDSTIKRAAATNVVQKYLAGLSADALAAKRSRSPLGTTIPFYKRLLAARPSPKVDDVAFELDLPVSLGISVKEIVKLRKTEMPTFQRFQDALRIAVAERVKTSASSSAKELAQEIKRDVINPELRRIRDLLATSRTQSAKSASIGLGLGVTAASIGLITPLSLNPIGTGLVVGGAVTMGMSSVKKSIDDHLAVKREVALSDMYFLWQAHKH